MIEHARDDEIDDVVDRLRMRVEAGRGRQDHRAGARELAACSRGGSPTAASRAAPARAAGAPSASRRRRARSGCRRGRPRSRRACPCCTGRSAIASRGIRPGRDRRHPVLAREHRELPVARADSARPSMRAASRGCVGKRERRIPASRRPAPPASTSSYTLHAARRAGIRAAASRNGMPEAPVNASVIGARRGSSDRSTRCGSSPSCAMTQHLVARRERAREPLDEIDRAMPAAGAADRDGQVVAVVARVVGQPARDEVVDVAVHPLDFGDRSRGTRPPARRARSAAQRRLVVRIGQAAHVEHEIGVERHAVLEAERLEQQRELRRGRR